MHQLTVVVAQKDQATADHLANVLQGRFRHVTVAHSGSELHDAILKLHATAAIVDLELINNEQLRNLCSDCPYTAVVATHRTPDIEMWMACLDLGAADCCHRNDVEGMLRAITHNVPLSRTARAA
jgi:DNA-binding NarL/FixJ family response regulator